MPDTLIGNTVGFNYGENREKALAVAFPKVDPGVIPLGNRVLVQYRVPKTVTSGGLILPQEVMENEIWNTQVAKILLLGPLAFRNRQSGNPWFEGAWCEIGDFVRVPKHGGDQWTIRSAEGDEVKVALWDDLQLLAKITGDPLTVRTFS